jgi:hypothetical protein
MTGRRVEVAVLADAPAAGEHVGVGGGAPDHGADVAELVGVVKRRDEEILGVGLFVS